MRCVSLVLLVFLQGDYAEAAQSYQRAGDLDNVVRLYLDHLNRPETAFDIVRENHSVRSSSPQTLSHFF